MRSHGDGWNENDIPCQRQFERTEPLADALGEGVSAEKKKRNVRPERERHRRELLFRQVQPPQAVQDRERGCAIGAAASESPADRYVLFDVEVDTSLRTALRLQEPGGAHREVFTLGNAGQGPRAPDLGVRARREAQPVAALDQAERGLQQVIAIGAPPDDVQEEIELGGGRITALPRIQSVHRSTMK